MRLKFVTTVDCSDGSYEAEFADDRGALSEQHLGKAIQVVRAVLAHLEAGRAETVLVDREATPPAGSPTRIKGKPDPGQLN